MSKGKRTVIDTGIYRHVVLSAGPDDHGELDEEAAKEVVDAAYRGFARWENLDSRLNAIQRSAEEIIGDKRNDQAVDDARLVLLRLEDLREHLGKGNVQTVAILALEVGRLVEQMGIRWAEPLVKQERTRRKAQRTSRQDSAAAKAAMARELFLANSPKTNRELVQQLRTIGKRMNDMSVKQVRRCLSGLDAYDKLLRKPRRTGHR
jgi:hypothetical protein